MTDLRMNTKFFLMSYNATNNVGDEIQSLAARQFLPQVDYYVERERTNSFVTPDRKPAWGIMNGWFCHHPQNWPPSDCISPLFLSMHIVPYPIPPLNLVPAEAMLTGPAREYLKAYGPIGARDTATLRMLEKAGVESYFSGCLTLTLERPDVPRGDLVVLCDVPEGPAEFVKQRNKGPVQSVTQSGYDTQTPARRFEIASELLKLYASAKCVVTTRLHCALPCIAMNTPVLLINTATDRNRFDGLLDLVNNCSPTDFLSGTYKYDFESPPQNPDRHLSLRSALRDRAASFITNAVQWGHPRPYPLAAEDRVRIVQASQSKTYDLLRRQDERIRKLEQSYERLSQLSGAGAAR